MAGVGYQHGQLLIGPQLRVGDGQPTSLEVSAGLEDNLSLSWQLSMESQGYSGSTQGQNRKGGRTYRPIGAPALSTLAGVLAPTRMGMANIWKEHILVGSSSVMVSVSVVSLRVISVVEGLVLAAGTSILVLMARAGSRSCGSTAFLWWRGCRCPGHLFLSVGLQLCFHCAWRRILVGRWVTASGQLSRALAPHLYLYCYSLQAELALGAFVLLGPISPDPIGWVNRQGILSTSWGTCGQAGSPTSG